MLGAPPPLLAPNLLVQPSLEEEACNVFAEELPERWSQTAQVCVLLRLL